MSSLKEFMKFFAMILISKYLIPNRYSGLAIYPFIFLKNKSLSDNYELINHERIHLKQQIELLWIFFFYGMLLNFYFTLSD